METITCNRCGSPKHRGRCKGGGVGKGSSKSLVEVVEKHARKAEAPPPVKLNGSLEVAAGLGFRASHEDGVICIEQDREDEGTIYTHQVTLAPHKARQLVDFIAARLEE